MMREYPNSPGRAPGENGEEKTGGSPLIPRGEQDALTVIRGMALEAAEEMEKILRNPKAPIASKIQVIDIILNRTFGKPEAALKLETAQQSVQKSYERIQEMLASIEEEGEPDGDRQ